jgi:hypothetical protein
MTTLTLPRVPSDEAAPVYSGYLAAVPDERVGMHLEAQPSELERLCADGVFAYRLLRISRGDSTELPGFDENSYVPEGQFNRRGIAELVSEFGIQRASTLALVNSIPPPAWIRQGSANGFRVSARALVYIILGHTAHHLGILRERYRLPMNHEDHEDTKSLER